MKRNKDQIIAKTHEQKHEALVHAFLVFNFQRKTDEEKQRVFEQSRPEVILRSMRLEDEWISEQDIADIIHKQTV